MVATKASIEQRIREVESRLLARYHVSMVEHRLSLTVEGSPLTVRVLEAGSGPPVVLLHPGTWFGTMWAPMLPHVSDRRILCVELPGHGLSGSVDYRRHHARDHTVALLGQVLSHFGIGRVPLVGNSLGGMSALWLAVDDPERVSQLVIMGVPAVGIAGGAPDFALSLMSIPVLNRLLLKLPSSPEQSRNLMKGSFGPKAWAQAPRELFEIHYLAGRRPEFAPTVSTLLQTLFRWKTPRPRMTLSDDELAGIQQPVRFLWGDKDLFGGPEIAERAAALMPDATVAVHPGGHHLQIDDPERCGRFLSDALAGESSATEGAS